MGEEVRVNGYHQDHETTHQPSSLKIIIIGAGLAGLTAAIALRRQGHYVDVYEQSQLASEVGAAIHLTPNCTGILKQLGIEPEQSGAVPLIQVCVCKS